jgi:hypothetical protein
VNNSGLPLSGREYLRLPLNDSRCDVTNLLVLTLYLPWPNCHLLDTTALTSSHDTFESPKTTRIYSQPASHLACCNQVEGHGLAGDLHINSPSLLRSTCISLLIACVIPSVALIKPTFPLPSTTSQPELVEPSR